MRRLSLPALIEPTNYPIELSQLQPILPTNQISRFVLTGVSDKVLRP